MIRIRTVRWLLFLLLSVGKAYSFEASTSADTQPNLQNTFCEPEILRAARSHGVPLAVLYAVGLTETGQRGRLQPFAMNADGKTFFPKSYAEAASTFASLKQAGAKFIDIGCMQINERFHGHQFGSLAAMFDPARNVDYAARFLVELKQREATWTMAVARYNAGPDNDPAQKKYICAVIGNMVRSGFGNWTPGSRLFCQ